MQPYRPLLLRRSNPAGRQGSRWPVVSLLTDFGLRDSYLGQVKAVIVGIAPSVQLIDISHEVPAGDVMAGAMTLETAHGAFPRGTVHLCVVDPGVGSDRLALAVRIPGSSFVAPDNGLLTPIFQAHPDAVARSIMHPLLIRSDPAASPDSRDERPLSATFHGRDLFAVAAARLAIGFPFARVGPIVPHPIRLSIPRPVVSDGAIHGEVVAIDHFGNAATNITRAYLSKIGSPVEVVCRNVGFGDIRRYYTEVNAGQPIALLDSASRLELAVNGGSAAGLGLEAGDPVEVKSRA